MPSVLLSCGNDDERDSIDEITSIKINERDITLRKGDKISLTVSHLPSVADAPTYNWATEWNKCQLKEL